MCFVFKMGIGDVKCQVAKMLSRVGRSFVGVFWRPSKSLLELLLQEASARVFLIRSVAGRDPEFKDVHL